MPSARKVDYERSPVISFLLNKKGAAKTPTVNHRLLRAASQTSSLCEPFEAKQAKRVPKQLFFLPLTGTETTLVLSIWASPPGTFNLLNGKKTPNVSFNLTSAFLC